MRTIQRIRRKFWMSVGLLSAMSATFLFMPLASKLEEQTGGWSVRILGLLFWLLAVTGYLTIVKANKMRKRFWHIRFGRDIQTTYRPGILCACANPWAKVIDSMLAVVTVVFAVCLMTPLRNTYFIIVFLSLLIWAVNMHCLFNGRIYRITKYEKSKERKGL